MARISRHHYGLRQALCSLADFDHIGELNEIILYLLATVETGGAGRFDYGLEMAAVHIAEQASKIAAGPEFVACRVGAAAGVAEWLDQSRTPACDLPHDDIP